jgi:sulfate transport system substrate-binding protein
MVVDKKDTRTAAVAYLKFTDSPEGQKISAKNYYRPRNSAVAKKYVHELSQPSQYSYIVSATDWRSR